MPEARVSSCQLPYPDRFHTAVDFVGQLPGASLSDDTKLLLYALQQQAQQGPCKDPKPWGWNVVESAKWQSWTQLGNMPQMEAMRLYVRTLDELQPDWWQRLAPPATNGGGPAAPQVSISSAFKPNTWVVIQQDDAKKPLPRYEQGAAMLGHTLYVLGGHYGGRYLKDLWLYDLNTLQWSVANATSAAAQVQDSEEAAAAEAAGLLDAGLLPASAGHSVTPWADGLLVLGGHVKGKQGPAELPVRLLDPVNLTWRLLPTYGKAPTNRGGHTACLVGRSLYVFGGEDVQRRPLGDVGVLDLDTMNWQVFELAGGPKAPVPPPRTGHCATVYQDKYLVVFGGGSIANCYNDLWVLDLEERKWSRPTLFGTLPSPRAGHSAALVGDTWYVLGGGNNVKGCVDMVAADLSDLSVQNVTWRRVCSVPAGSPLSSEGVSLLHVDDLGLLVAFGGYNGKYHNTVSVYKLPLQEDSSELTEEATGAPAAAAAGAPASAPQAAAAAAGAAAKPSTPKAAAAAVTGGSPKVNGSPALQQQPAAAAASGLSKSSSAQAISPPSPSKSANGVEPSGSSSGMLKDIALAREQLKRDLAATQQQLAESQAAAAAAGEAAAAEAGLLRRQLGAAQSALAETEKALEEARHALSAEQARTLKLEAQLAEAREKLGTVTDLERALERYQKVEAATAAAEAQAAGKKEGNAGLWGYLTGGQ